MPIFNRKPASEFRWTAEAKAHFAAAFRVVRDGSGEGPVLTLDGIITQRMDDRDSWGVGVETEYYGWIGVGQSWEQLGGRRIPFYLKATATDEEHRRRESHNRTAIPPLGDMYLSTARREPDLPDGFEFNLRLDRRRHRSFTRALSDHRGEFAPRVSFLLAPVPKPEQVTTADKVCVQAYWLNTVPMDIRGYQAHPYVRQRRA